MADKDVKVDLSELKKFMKKLDRNLDKWFDIALTDYALMLEEMIVDEIEKRHISVSGEMKKSITHDVTKQLHGWLINVGTNLKTASGYPYPVGVHEGTKPHGMPMAPLREWVRLKLNISKEKENRRVAWAIWWKIKKFGTKPNPFMGAVFAKEKHRINREIGNALFRAMKGGRVV